MSHSRLSLPFGASRRGRLSGALLRNYLAEARAIARSGGGNLWVIEPGVGAECLPEVADAVARHLTRHGVRTGGVVVLKGTSSARVQVLPSG